MANSVINLLEIFFPKTIDILAKEKSDFDGPKPIIIDEASGHELLWKLLSGCLVQDRQEDINNEIEFGCN